MDEIIENPGLDIIGNKIVNYVGIKHIGTCRLVSKSMKNLVERQKIWYIRQIRGVLKIRINAPHRFRNKFGEKTETIKNRKWLDYRKNKWYWEPGHYSCEN